MVDERWLNRSSTITELTEILQEESVFKVRVHIEDDDAVPASMKQTIQQARKARTNWALYQDLARKSVQALRKGTSRGIGNGGTLN